MLSKFIFICSVLALWKTKPWNLFKRKLPLQHESVSPVTHRNPLFQKSYPIVCWYDHFASCFPTVIYDVFMHNNAFWSNSNAFSLIICKVHTKRENSRSWKSGPGKATSGYLFCTTPNKLKLHGDFLRNI